MLCTFYHGTIEIRVALVDGLSLLGVHRGLVVSLLDDQLKGH